MSAEDDPYDRWRVEPGRLIQPARQPVARVATRDARGDPARVLLELGVAPLVARVFEDEGVVRW